MVGKSNLAGTELDFYPLADLPKAGLPDASSLPMTVKVLLEGLVRLAETGTTAEENVSALAAWPAAPSKGPELPFLPARVLLQDFTGVPAVVGLAALRSALKRAGKDAGEIDPLVPVPLTLHHPRQRASFAF